ncbi:MAG: alpha-2-macroglobulin family protein, partial [Haloferula sp.]
MKHRTALRHLFWGFTCLALTIAGALKAQAPPTDETEVRDLSTPPVRELGARISMNHVSWDVDDQKPRGAAVTIRFSGPAAPLDQVGKKVRPGLVRMNPEAQGEWQWKAADRLEFSAAEGWLPPGDYRFQIKPGLLTEDCRLAEKTDLARLKKAPRLSARFNGREYYIDPSTPALQQLVTTVSFSHPVSLEEVREHFSVTSVTGIEIFQPGSKPQVLPDEKDPRQFHLRSPLMKPGEKEDLILFQLRSGLKATVGGLATSKHLETKVTAYSRESRFFMESVGTMLRKTEDGEPEQAVFLELSIPSWPEKLAAVVQAWKLPPETRDEKGRWKSWSKDNVTDEVLKKAERLPLELVRVPDAPPMERALTFRVPQQEGGKIFVKVPKGTMGPGGFVTPEDFREVTTLNFIPRETDLVGNGGLLALNGERKINVRSRGLDHLRYTVARVQTDQINHLVSQTRGSFESPYFSSGFGFEDISEYEQSVQQIVKEDEYGVNYSSFDFAPLVDAARGGAEPKHGLFYLTVEGVRRRTADDGDVAESSPNHEWLPLSPRRSRYYGFRHRSDSGISYPIGDRLRDGRFVLVTDLGLIMKESADGTRSVFVQSFREQGPVLGVGISVLARNGRQLASGMTDDSGWATLPSLRGLEREQQPVALVARKGDDLAFIPWAKSERRIDKSRYDVWGVQYSQASALSASLFTERGIYRPGESIHVGGIVRQRDWLGDLSGLPVELVLVNAKQDIAGRFPLKLGEGGVFSHTLPTTESSPTGPWQVYLEQPKPEGEGSRRGTIFLGETIVRVEEFQPDRLKIKASFEPRVAQGWVSPEGLAVSVQLDTLFGIAAANRRVAGKLHLSRSTPYFSAWPGWRFGLPNDNYYDSREISLKDATTDENGQASLLLDMEAHTAPMLRARVELEGFEADGGRGVKTELSTLVSRQSYLIGHKAERSLSYLDERDPVPVEVVAIGPDSKPVEVADLTRVLIQTKHASVLTKQKNGSLAYESQSRDEVVESIKVSLPAKPGALVLPLKNPGKFRYEFRNAAGQTLCSIPFFVAGKADLQKDLERSGELEIHFEDKEWLPGEELEFSLTTPFTGAGLITIERDSVIKHQWFKCDTKTSVQSVKLPDEIEGGVYLSVVMARSLDSPDVFLNPLASGIRRVDSARGDRQMEVTLDAVDRVRPGERLSIGYRAPKGGQVVIWAVDEGIHLVSDYRAPDPLEELIPGAALEVETYQLMDVLMPEFSLLRKALAIGGDGGGADHCGEVDEPVGERQRAEAEEDLDSDKRV